MIIYLLLIYSVLCEVTVNYTRTIVSDEDSYILLPVNATEETMVTYDFSISVNIHYIYNDECHYTVIVNNYSKIWYHNTLLYSFSVVDMNNLSVYISPYMCKSTISEVIVTVRYGKDYSLPIVLFGMIGVVIFFAIFLVIYEFRGRRNYQSINS